jgi:DNA-binding NtrC family response regulator
MKPTILLTFLEPDDVERSELVTIFREEGFAPLEVTNRKPLRRAAGRPPFAAVLVLSQFDPCEAEKALGMMHDYIREDGGNPAHVIACGRDLIPKDENALRDAGSDKVIRPATWKARQVSERVLAALYGGFITPREGERADTFVKFEEGEKPYIECEVPYKRTTETRRLIGHTRIMRELRTKIKAYGSSPDPVLIRGATGTGKELVAAAIHSSNEANKAKDYIPINISELGQEVLPSELFGHVKGAFTGAVAKRQGLLEEAGDGTVFIDEIGDLDLPNQARLLRVFENRQIRPVGARYKERVAFNARLIFATHKYLERMCAEGGFRQDLYQRLREVHNLDVPLLSKRPGDLELLTKEFFGKWKEERAGRHTDTFDLKQSDYDKVVDLCIGHEFRGNVRGLRGILRACFSDSLIDRRFNIERLRSEIDIDRRQVEKSGRGDGEGISTGPHLPSITFDPSGEKYQEFLEKARAEYFTQVYRTAGRQLEQGSKVSGVTEKTFRQYLPKSELGRKHKLKASEDTPEIKNGAVEEN